MSADTVTFQVVLPPDDEVSAVLGAIADRHAARWLAGEVGRDEAMADAEREGREAIVARIAFVPVSRTDSSQPAGITADAPAPPADGARSETNPNTETTNEHA